MQLIMENWRRYLKEEALKEAIDYNVGNLTRQVITNLFQIIDKMPGMANKTIVFVLDKESFSKNYELDLKKDEVVYLKPDKNIELDWIRFNFWGVVQESAFALGSANYSTTSAMIATPGTTRWKTKGTGYTLHAPEAAAEISITLRYNEKLEGTQLSDVPQEEISKISRQIFDTLAHETTHARQEVAGRDPASTQGKERAPSGIDFSKGTRELEKDELAHVAKFARYITDDHYPEAPGFIRYLLLPNEVEAHVAGMWYASKEYNLSFEDMIDEYFNDMIEVVETAAKQGGSRAEWFGSSDMTNYIKWADHTKKHYLSYAREHYEKTPGRQVTDTVAKAMWGGVTGLKNILTKTAKFFTSPKD